MYCIIPAAHRPAVHTRGIADTQLRAVETDGIAAVVSEHDSRPAAALDAIRMHNAVVESSMDDGVTPVPVRFGQWLEDDDAVRMALSSSHEKWELMLAHFAGCVEFGIRIFDPSSEEEAAAPRPRTGREYMASLANRLAGPAERQAEAVEALRSGVAGLYSDERIEPLRTKHGVASVAYLVHRPEADAYLTAVERVQMRMPGLRYLSTGPWPPYSFVD